MQAWLLGKPKTPTPEKRKKTLIWVRGPPKTGQDTDPATQPLLPTPRNLVLSLLMCLCLCSLPKGGAGHLLQQQGNVWVTWANQTGRTDFCLSLQSATSPFRTCLIGVPFWVGNSDPPEFLGYLRAYNISNRSDPCHIYCRSPQLNDIDLANETFDIVGKKVACVICRLNVSLPWEPQELQLLGSQGVPNDTWVNTTWLSPGCIGFARVPNQNYSLLDSISRKGPYWNSHINRSDPFTDVFPRDRAHYYWGKEYCGYTANKTTFMLSNNSCTGIWISVNTTVTIARPDGFLRNLTCSSYNVGNSNTSGCCVGPALRGQGEERNIWNNYTAKALPSGIFLVCGDRAWQGIPVKPVGGPCYLGHLTVLSPKVSEWLQIMNRTRMRTKRDLRQLSPNCSDEVRLWGMTARVFASLFPPVGAAQALKEIEQLACWSVKQANATTLVLNEMLEDMNSIRHALLQNRAAIDFLLLAQSHGCEDVEGFCCFNLSDHSASIHKQLQWMQGHTQKIKMQADPFGEWLEGLFGELEPWLKQMLKTLIVGLAIFLAIMLCLPCFVQLLKACLRNFIEEISRQQYVYQRIQEQL